jgi:pyruvate, orthophosphate dikinase
LQLGGKGANLAEMASIGLSVPPGFTVSTEACQQYQQAAGQALPPGLWDDILDGLRWVEEYMGARLGDPDRPLLLSVRSGAAVREATIPYFFLPLPSWHATHRSGNCRCRCPG